MLGVATTLPLLVAAALFGPRLWRASGRPEPSAGTQGTPSAAGETLLSSTPSQVGPPGPTAPPTTATPAGGAAPSGPARPPAPRPTEPPPRRPVTLPAELRRSEPVVPAGLAGRCAGQEVLLALVVGEDGSVRRARVLRAAVPECGEVAITAARTFEYRPALDASGAAVEATISIAVTLGAPEEAATPLPGGGLP